MINHSSPTTSAARSASMLSNWSRSRRRSARSGRGRPADQAPPSSFAGYLKLSYQYRSPVTESACPVRKPSRTCCDEALFGAPVEGFSFEPVVSCFQEAVLRAKQEERQAILDALLASTEAEEGEVRRNAGFNVAFMTLNGHTRRSGADGVSRRGGVSRHHHSALAAKEPKAPQD